LALLTYILFNIGSLEDMRLTRQSLSLLPTRPAILRKDFLISPYQLLEARLNGADSVLLIVSLLPPALLRSMIHKSRELGMEPLVEVNTEVEMKEALEAGARVIGVNNRDLSSFEVDMGNTGRVGAMLKGREDIILLALR
jgi:anthranilate synthase/indole-3-glycerol phosphate synthase/phosphoribosylanthranilate isomerase